MKCHIKIAATTLIILQMITFVGCGKESMFELVPVSGVVTVSGQPAAHVMVRFKPIPKEGSINSGPSSVAYTDEEGRFFLKSISGQKLPGAVSGQHRVTILGKESISQVSEWSKGDVNDYPPGEVPAGVRALPEVEIPAPQPTEYTVPSEGTSSADFQF